MLDPQYKNLIHEMSKKGMSYRKISCTLGISRNTVRKLLNNEESTVSSDDNTRNAEFVSLVRELFKRCNGNVVRIQEILLNEYQQDVAYSTLTRIVRTLEMRHPKRRAGSYHFEPGEEMQHDTSPHKLKLGEKQITAQCASLVLACSRRIFIQYYPCFTRFEAKAFLHAAMQFMEGSCYRCVIDNTSVVLASGSGRDAVITQEMEVFGRMFGFEFIAHAIGHADRKARVERPFYYVETNFLAGRVFNDWHDLNHQAIQWCINANRKEKRALGMTSDAAYLQEKPYLIALPKTLPPIFIHCVRQVDISGYVNLDSNRYSAPERLVGKKVDVYKYLNEVQIFHNHEHIATHPRLIGSRFKKSTLSGHHTKQIRMQSDNAASQIERQLKGHHDILDKYIKQLKQHVRGRGFKQLNRLLNIKQTYPPDAFLSAITKAEHYGLYDLNRLEDLVLKYVAGEFFNL